MNKNIKAAFDKAEKENRAALIGYVVGCDPTFEDSKLIINEMLKYCDLIEVGIPFNTSTSDSATIMDANDRALANGANTKKVLKLIKEVKDNTNKPIGTMSYLNQIHSLGIKNFVKEVKNSKVDFSIVVDSNLNSDEDKELYQKMSEIDVGYIKLIAPTNDENYIKQALNHASSWIYVVSYAGITGSKKYNLEFIKNSVKLIRKNSNLKIGCGFGIRTEEDVKEVSRVSDAVIIGSAIVSFVKSGVNNKLSGLEIAKQIGNYLRPITNALIKD
jgi:tryptophan synthase alpha chain